MAKEIYRSDILDLKIEFEDIIDSTLNITERENRIIEYLQTHYPIFYYQIKHERLGEVKKFRVNNIHHSTIFKYQYSKFKIIVISI